MKLELPKTFGQKDLPWGPRKLGTSTVSTFNTDGCLLTIAAMMCRYHGRDTDPGRLSDALIPVKGFYQGARLVYGAISDVFPDITVDWKRYIECPDQPAPLETIFEALDEGLMPLLKVVTPKIPEHWVAAIGYVDVTRELLIWDPLDKAEYFFIAKYGDPRVLIHKIVVYQGPLPPKTPSSGTTEPQNGIPDAIQDELEKITRRLDNIQKQVDNLSADREILERIQASQTEAKETTKLNTETLTNIRKEMKEEFRDTREQVAVSIKEAFEPPLEGEGTKFEVVGTLGPFFIGRRK